jgi:hypothetical protein
MRSATFKSFLGVTLIVLLAGLAGCGQDESASITVTIPARTPTQTAAPTTPPTATPTVAPTTRPTATPTPRASATPTATATAAPNACLPSSSLGVLVSGTNATVYAPLGNWGGGSTGVEVVPVETSAGIGKGGSPTEVSTSNTVNSCSANSLTGETVCVANTRDVYLINGTTLKNTLTSDASIDESFSGGSCENCGVVTDSTTDKALLTIGIDESSGPGAYQFLDLSGTSPVFETAVPAQGEATSEDASIDPTRHLVLSPNEVGDYQILNISGTTPALFKNPNSSSPVYDSAAEDCTTGIALATDEGTGNVFLADLTQATFKPGTPAGTWTAPSNLENFPEFDDFSAGTCGIAVAPGTHVAIVTGEFGGNLEGVLELPATSGTGTPAVVDYVAFTVPSDPSGAGWSEGFDPHTVTSYVSPNTKKPYAVLMNGTFTFLAIVDLDGMLKAPRTGAHTATTPLPAGLVTFVAM